MVSLLPFPPSLNATAIKKRIFFAASLNKSLYHHPLRFNAKNTIDNELKSQFTGISDIYLKSLQVMFFIIGLKISRPVNFFRVSLTIRLCFNPVDFNLISTE